MLASALRERFRPYFARIFVDGYGGGNDASSFNSGVEIVDGGIVHSHAGAFIRGAGGNFGGSGSSNYGVRVSSTGSRIETIVGSILVDASRTINFGSSSSR